ncbi:MAG: 5-formyltetrahydrofolate cyclo-ligase [Dongiaceae bacterium]
MTRWDEVRDWRRAKRAELRSRRVSLSRDKKDRVRATVTTLLRQHVPEFAGACIGFCWPYKGEIDFRHFIRSAVEDGAEAALPVVVERAQPLEFWSWRPHIKMQRGIWNIPIPADRRPVQPTVLLVPLMGFDERGYRLGYGGGYFDRTLATLTPKPLTIGVGYELSRLPTIYPQPHDIPMDAIVTENGFVWMQEASRPDGDVDEQRGFASSPCSMHELDPSSLGYMSRAEVLTLLGQLLEGERAGARSVGVMSKEAPQSQVGAVLRDIASDEARFCAMLTLHIRRLGGIPSSATGAFYVKVIALNELDQRLDLLNRGQGWVVRKLQEALPRIDDGALREGLWDMLQVHERNIATCTQVKQTLETLEYPANRRGSGEMENHAENPKTVQRRAATP